MLHRLLSSIYFEIEPPNTEKTAFRASTQPMICPKSVASERILSASATISGHSLG